MKLYTKTLLNVEKIFAAQKNEQKLAVLIIIL